MLHNILDWTWNPSRAFCQCEESTHYTEVLVDHYTHCTVTPRTATNPQSLVSTILFFRSLPINLMTVVQGETEGWTKKIKSFKGWCNRTALTLWHPWTLLLASSDPVNWAAHHLSKRQIKKIPDSILKFIYFTKCKSNLLLGSKCCCMSGTLALL